MTTDIIQSKHMQMRARLAKFRDLQNDSDAGLELTRMENFLDGRSDIFDVLEQHTANKAPLESSLDLSKPSQSIPKSQEPLEDFWQRLKKQLKRLKEEKIID